MWMFQSFFQWRTKYSQEDCLVWLQWEKMHLTLERLDMLRWGILRGPNPLRGERKRTQERDSLRRDWKGIAIGM